MNYLSQIKLPEKLDLYRIGLGFVKNKIKWDIKSEARKSKKELSQLKNKYSGKKMVLLCNGPSLNKVDFQTFGRPTIPHLKLI